MKQYELFELSFDGEPLEDTWADIDLAAVFVNKQETVAVKGFYNGDGVCVIRFLPRFTGVYEWTVNGIHQSQGQTICLASTDHHGPVRTKGIHFEYSDGTRFIPIGTTVYALAHQTDELVTKTLATLENAPFNKVRMCVFPKHYEYSKDEPEHFAFDKNPDGTWNVNTPNIVFWQRFERILTRLCQMGIEVDLILFHPYDCWGFAKLTVEQRLTYLDLVIRRLSAFPNIWWSMANEHDLMYHFTMDDWYAIEIYIAENDPFRHLLSNHNCYRFYDFTRPQVTHASIQSAWVAKTGDYIKNMASLLYTMKCVMREM